jgi:RNA polymerase sigma-70 factor (ECF subfamily)
MRGDRDAFRELVDQTSDRAYAIATRILRDADLAEDALQGALITAWRELPGLRDPDRFEAWLRRLVVHACYAEARRRRSWAANVRILPVDGPAGPDELLSVADRDALERAFRRLTIEQRAVFVLHHHVGLPLVEIAESLGIPPATARTRLHRAIRALRAAVEADLAPVVSQGRMA